MTRANGPGTYRYVFFGPRKLTQRGVFNLAGDAAVGVFLDFLGCARGYNLFAGIIRGGL